VRVGERAPRSWRPADCEKSRRSASRPHGHRDCHVRLREALRRNGIAGGRRARPRRRVRDAAIWRKGRADEPLAGFVEPTRAPCRNVGVRVRRPGKAAARRVSRMTKKESAIGGQRRTPIHSSPTVAGAARAAVATAKGSPVKCRSGRGRRGRVSDAGARPHRQRRPGGLRGASPSPERARCAN